MHVVLEVVGGTAVPDSLHEYLFTHRFSFNDDAVELYAERVAKRGLCAQTQVRGLCDIAL